MIIALVSVVAFWYVAKAVGRREARVGRWTDAAAVWTGRLHTWVMSAPATFCYIAVFSCFTLVQTTAPPRLIDIMTRVDSTNVHHLRGHAVDVLATSAFWVADKGSGLALFALGFGTVVAWAERRFGTPRILLIGLSGHVLGTLLTERLLQFQVDSGRAPAKLLHATDVGVSYILVACLTAAVLVMHGLARPIGAVVLLASLAVPMITSGTIWDLGHVVAAACGLATALICRAAAPLRGPPAEADSHDAPAP